jgi:hypothetical protein
MNPDELFRMLFAQNAGGMDIGGIERGTFNNAKDFEEMLTGLMASMNPGAVDPKAFQPIVSYGDPVNLPSRALFEQSMLDPTSEEGTIAQLVNGNMQPSGVYSEFVKRFEQSEGMQLGEMDDKTRGRVESAAADAKKYATSLWDEQRTWAQETSQLSPEAREAADRQEATYRPRIEEESAASKEYTDKGLPTPVDQWQMSDFGQGNDGTNEMLQTLARERFQSLAAQPTAAAAPARPGPMAAPPTFDSASPDMGAMASIPGMDPDTARAFRNIEGSKPDAVDGREAEKAEKYWKSLGFDGSKSGGGKVLSLAANALKLSQGDEAKQYWNDRGGSMARFSDSQKATEAARLDAARKVARTAAGDDLVASNRNRSSQESMSRFQRDQLAQQGVTPFVAAMQAAMGGGAPRRPTTMMSYNDFAGYQNSPRR